jgi:hypothetical protein
MTEDDFKYINLETYKAMVELNKKQAEIIKDLMDRNDKLKKALAKYMRPLKLKGDQ